MKKLIPVLTVLCIAGCATPEQRAQQTIERYGPYCEGLGFAKNTDEWRKCIQKEHARVTEAVMGDD